MHAHYLLPRIEQCKAKRILRACIYWRNELWINHFFYNNVSFVQLFISCRQKKNSDVILKIFYTSSKHIENWSNIIFVYSDWKPMCILGVLLFDSFELSWQHADFSAVTDDTDFIFPSFYSSFSILLVFDFVCSIFVLFTLRLVFSSFTLN